jgi:hypothetical protein
MIHNKLNKDEYDVALSLIFRNAEDLHAAISVFLNQTTLSPIAIFSVRRITPIILLNESKGHEIQSKPAVVEFEFVDPAGQDSFMRHAAPHFRTDYKIATETRGPEVHIVRLESNTSETLKDQVRRINRLFQEIQGKFGKYSIESALEELHDPRFYEERQTYVVRGASSAQWGFDHHTDIEVTSESMEERVAPPDQPVDRRDLSQEDLRVCLEDPAAWAKRRREEYNARFVNRLVEALCAPESDNQKLQPLMAEAFRRNLNMAAVMEQVAQRKREVKQ